MSAEITCLYCGKELTESLIGGINVEKNELICNDCIDPDLPEFLSVRKARRIE